MSSGLDQHAALLNPGIAAFYLDTGIDPVFSVVHEPESAPSGVGVVMCPSFGWDDMCIHRTKRTWAERLREAGHTTIRFDLPGTGDSPGSPRDPERLRAWLAAVTAAATWLRTERNCSRVVGFGVGFGGMLAWLAASEGAPVDDLILWAVPTQGRRLLREIRAAAQLSIDSVIEPRPDLDPDLIESSQLGADLLDESGQVVTQETLASLGDLDLTALPLPNAAARRVLVFARSGNDVDANLADCFRAAGADVTVADGSEYAAMMQYVQHSQLPVEAVARSIRWLEQVKPAPAEHPAPISSSKTFKAASVLETTYDGVAIRERPITLRLGPRTLRGILTEPVDAACADLCAVFFSGGSDRRLGPNRMWVDASRRWAAQGVASARVDPAGIGDSDGDESFWTQFNAHYHPDHIPQTVELLNALEREGTPSRFVLTGFCSGANRSFQVAINDERVVGVFAIGLPFFFWNWWTVHIRDWWVADWVPTSVDKWKKTTAVRLIQRGLLVLTRLRRIAVRLAPHRPDRTDIALKRLADRGTEFLIFFKLESHELAELVSEGRYQRLSATPGVEIELIPGRDIRFRPLALQGFVNRKLDAALARVLESRRDSAPAPTQSRSWTQREQRCSAGLAYGK